MSRERPIAMPPTVPDDQRGKVVMVGGGGMGMSRAELEALTRVKGPALLVPFFNPFNRPSFRAPRFIRSGYEASIVDDLRDFYARRPRPWRPAANAPKVNSKTMRRSISRRENHHRQLFNAVLRAAEENKRRREAEQMEQIEGGGTA